MLKQELYYPNDGDMVWCVFDRDDNTNQNLYAAEQLAEHLGYRVAFSNPCFELWILLHFRDQRAELLNAEKGIRHIGNNRVLGYDEIRGVLTPNEDAWIIKQIYYDFVSGLYTTEIAKRLNGVGARSLRGNQFCISTVLTILRNEIYVGDRCLQKRPPKNYLTHKPDLAEEYDTYYLSDDHEAIIARETWNRAQTRLNDAESERLKQIHNRGNAHFLYGHVFCSECGMPYKRRTLKNRDGSYYKAWNCRERQKGIKGNGCKNIVIKEDELLRAIAAQMQLVTLDEGIFLRTVERVTIGKFDIWIKMKGISESDNDQSP